VALANRDQLDRAAVSPRYIRVRRLTNDQQHSVRHYVMLYTSNEQIVLRIANNQLILAKNMTNVMCYFQSFDSFLKEFASSVALAVNYALSAFY